MIRQEMLPKRKLIIIFLTLVLSILGVGGCKTDDDIDGTESINVSGTWTGSATDSSGPGTITLVLSQSGTNVTGNFTMTTPGGLTGRGTFSGTLNGSILDFTVIIPRGGIDSPYGNCQVDFTGSAVVNSNTMNGTYSGINSCTGPFNNGVLTLRR